MLHADGLQVDITRRTSTGWQRPCTPSRRPGCLIFKVGRSAPREVPGPSPALSSVSTPGVGVQGSALQCPLGAEDTVKVRGGAFTAGCSWTAVGGTRKKART